MASRIFDPTLFRGQGALMTLRAMAGPRKLSDLSTSLTHAEDNRDRALSVYLRWQLNPKIGMPSEPFKVWRRPAIPLAGEIKQSTSSFAFPPLGRVVVFSEPMISFTATIKAGASGGKEIVLPMADGVGFENIVGMLDFDLPANGAREFTFQSPYMTGLLLLGTGNLQSLHALPMTQAEKIKAWELVETVGLPVDEDRWKDLGGQQHGIKQGLVGAEVDSISAAAQRFTRGINPFGWYPFLPTGQPAPVWEMPSVEKMVADANEDVLDMLHEAMDAPPEKQWEFDHKYLIHPPENANGKRLDADDSQASVKPLSLLQMAVASDPMQAVVLGFGTGYPYEDLPSVVLGKTSFFNDPNVSDWDYMVTGLWEHGLDGKSEPREYAALIPRPRRVVPPPPPADLKLDFLAHQQPVEADQPWVASVRLSWERFVLDNIVTVASFALARSDLTTGGAARALMEPRPTAGGRIPIGNTQNPEDPERTRQSATDSGFPIPPDPGTVNARYGVSTQNIFGVRSPWITQPFNSHQPAPDVVQIVEADLVPSDTGSGTVCPAKLVIEFVVDWRVRRPEQVSFRGRLFAAATRDQAPPATMPASMQKTLAGAAQATIVTFNNDIPLFQQGEIISLDVQGSKKVTPGAAKQGQSRRYRVTIEGFSLDYAATPHIGLALQARSTERISPHRISAWTPQPKVAYASDPRARTTPVFDTVHLASLPDASGQCHAQLKWHSQPSAQGYVLYESNETLILTAGNTPDPLPGTLLSDRLTTLKTAFDNNPDRNSFTRVNDALLTRASLDVTLPRGSRVIHVWIVLPVSHGGIEAPWPSGPEASDALIAYAAPQIAEPAPPVFEVRRISDDTGFAAKLQVGTCGSAGARPTRIDIYRTRVADAARQLDSMGFPLAQISNTTGKWIVTETGETPDRWIESVKATDTPEGSWNSVWYRAVAWADDDPQRGLLKGRSRPSAAASVIIPPDAPPLLTPLTPSWPGGGIADVQLDFSTDVPIVRTALGDHRIQVEMREKGNNSAILSETLPMREVLENAPATGSGLWRVADGGNRNYRLLVQRADVNTVVSVVVRIIDPIGRMSEQTYRIEAGSILPLPVISKIDGFSISGRGKFYSFTIDNAPDDSVGGQFYHLRITLTPRVTRPTRPGPLRPFPFGSGLRPGSRPSLVRPRPGLVRDPGFGRRKSLFRKINGKLVFFKPVKDVPTQAKRETFTLSGRRMGERLFVTVIAQKKISAILVEVITPDGRSVSRKARG